MHSKFTPFLADLEIELLVLGGDEVYSPSAIDTAPATSPATPPSTTVSLEAAAPRPATRAVLVTSPSMAPKTAARSQPPETSV